MAEAPAPPAAPFAAKRPTERIVHGERLVDDYAWLRDENWREVMRDPAKLKPEIRTYLEAENRHAEAYFADAAELQKRLVAEMRGRIKEDDSTVPSRDGAFAYYVRYREGGQHPLLCRVPSAGGDEQLLLDGDALAKGHAYYNLGPSRHSRDHGKLAWSADAAGSEFFTIRVRELVTGTELADEVPDTTGGAVWTADASAFYYVRLDADHRPSHVYLHKLGTQVSDDRLIYEETDPGFFVGVGELQAGVFAAIGVSASETTENYLLDLSETELDILHIHPGGVLAGLGDHARGHVDPDDATLAGHLSGGKETVDTSAAPEVEDGLACSQLGDRLGVATAKTEVRSRGQRLQFLLRIPQACG